MISPDADADLRVLSPEMRQALMRHAPEYFTLSPEDREAQRAAWCVAGTDSVTEAIRKQLLVDALGKTPQEVDAIEADEESLSASETSRINTLMQQIRGIGDDFFSWNEFLAEGETALSFETIGAYDRADHEFQERALAGEKPDYAPRPYRGRLYAAWARYMIGGEIRYATLSDRASFIADELESVGREVIAELVPHRYVKGSEHGKTAGDGYRVWDRRLDAGGFEALHDALAKASHKMVSDRLEAWREEAFAAGEAGEAPTVWLFSDTDWPDGCDPESVHVVFSGPAAMDLVHPRSFCADCARLAGDLARLKADVEKEKADFRTALRAAHADLAPLHPKGVAPLKRRRQIRIAPAALDALSRIAEGSED